MDGQKRAALLRTELATKLRGFFNDALNDADMLPGKAALKARIAEEFGDVPGIDQGKLYDAFVEYARKAQDKSARFDLRQHATEVTVALVSKLQAADRLIDADEGDDFDAGALADSTMYADRIGGELDLQERKERAEAQELLRRAGYQA